MSYSSPKIKYAPSKKIAGFVVSFIAVALFGCDHPNDSNKASQASSPLQSETQPFGWASMYTDASGIAHATTGGEGAAEECIYIVTNRQELNDALNNIRSQSYVEGDASAELAAKLEPKIIYWQGTIRGDDLGNGNYADAEYYKTTPSANQFGFDLYVKSFDTQYIVQLDETIAAGGTNAAAAQEEKDLLEAQSNHMKKYAANQKAQIQSHIPPNTTILGVGVDAKLVNGTLLINTMTDDFGTTENSNIIIRNISFQAPRDLAPEWDADDGPNGHWNSRYDAVTINTGKNIWVDHCSFTDGEFLDANEEIIFGQHVQRHDGLLDITFASDYITVSYNYFNEHEKTTLVGSSDRDKGDFRVTFTGNHWYNVSERAPRVRWGKVHIYNNLYTGATDADYPIVYSIGMGYQSSILSESNSFNYSGSGAEESIVLIAYKGTNFKDVGSWYNDEPAQNLNQIAIDKCTALQDEEKAKGTVVSVADRTDWVAATCTNDIGWQPPYTYTVAKSVDELKTYIKNNTGAGKLDITIPDTTS